MLETPELNQARAAVRELNEELERRIEERTCELAAANEDLKGEIAERKEAEEALRLERDFAEGMIETAQTIVLALDTPGRIVRFNPYMEKVSGYGLGEVQGKDWFTTFVPEHDRERIHRLFLNAIGNISTHGNVNPIVTKDGARARDEVVRQNAQRSAGQRRRLARHRSGHSRSASRRKRRSARRMRCNVRFSIAQTTLFGRWIPETSGC